MDPITFLRKYISALTNPGGFVQEAESVADKIRARNAATEEAIDKLLRQPNNQDFR